MRYVLSGLVGFLLTLALSIPLQQLIQLRELKAGALRAKATSGLVETSMDFADELTISVPPLRGGLGVAGEPRIKFLPQYPAEAAAQGLEGFVTLSFTVAADGSVQNLKILESHPRAVFDKAATRAVGKWNFRVAAGKLPDSKEQRLRLVFNLKKTLASESQTLPGL